MEELANAIGDPKYDAVFALGSLGHGGLVEVSESAGAQDGEECAPYSSRGCILGEGVGDRLGGLFLLDLGGDDEHTVALDGDVDSSRVVAGRKVGFEAGGAVGGGSESHPTRASLRVGGDESLEDVDEIAERWRLAERRWEPGNRCTGRDGLPDADIGSERLERSLLVEAVDVSEPLQDDLEEGLMCGADSLESDVPAGAPDQRAVVDGVAVAA